MDSLQTEGEPARALREIRARDPSFDMVTFLRNLKTDVRTVIKVRCAQSKSRFRRRRVGSRFLRSLKTDVCTVIKPHFTYSALLSVLCNRVSQGRVESGSGWRPL